MKLRLVLAALIACCIGDAAFAARIKDITTINGPRDNQLLGYGLVIGLQGTGDSIRNSPFTEQSMRSMLDRLGIKIQANSLRIRNVAGVIVTATLPPYASNGSRIDVNISSIGDATSLKGGTLVMTPLVGADGKTYAVAQGPLAVSGFAAQGQSETLSQGVATDGRIPGGGLIEREIPGTFATVGPLMLELVNPDFRTATVIADTINAYTLRVYGEALALERDMRSVVIKRPPRVTATRFIADIGDLFVEPDAPARVVVDQRTGTVVIGKDVQISTVALTHGNLTVRVTEQPQVSQPQPFSKGETTTVPRTAISANEEGGHIAVISGASLQALVDGLNRVGLRPSGIIAILQAIKTSGALQAELVIQ
jgi:flagellar P-ring protein precursor FlgI